MLMEVIKTLSQKKNSIVELVNYNGKEYIAKYYPYYCRSMFIELNILATVKHSNVLSMVTFLPPNNIEPARMLLPKLDNNLIDMLEGNFLSVKDKINYLLQIAHGIRYLHHNHIVHLDLKLDNIMVHNGNAVIIDFGTSEYLFEEKINTCQTKCTVTHRPPEAFQSFGNVYSLDYSSDIWSFGIIMYEILSGIPMHKNPVIPKYMCGINSDPRYDYNYDNVIHEFISSPNFGKNICKYIPYELRSCLSYSPKFRPQISQVIESLKKFMFLVGAKENIFDESLSLKLVSYETINYNKNAFQYYDKIVSLLKNNHSDVFLMYPKVLIYATFDLIHRMLPSIDDVDKSYIDQAIVICCNFLSNGYIVPFDQIIPYFSNKNKKRITDEIITKTGGIIFQHYFYTNSFGIFNSDYAIMNSPYYFCKTQKLIKCEQNI